jgi:hypothetical protein
MSWSRAFHIPIPLPDGRVLRTLRDAGEYIQELPKAIHQRPEWQIAAEMLLEAVEGKGPLMFAKIAMRKAVNAGKPAPEPASGNVDRKQYDRVVSLGLLTSFCPNVSDVVYKVTDSGRAAAKGNSA